VTLTPKKKKRREKGKKREKRITLKTWTTAKYLRRKSTERKKPGKGNGQNNGKA